MFINVKNTQDHYTRYNFIFEFVVSSPIIIDVNRNPQVVHFGDKVNIRCTAIGYPPPIYNFKFKVRTFYNITIIKKCLLC